MDEVFTIKEVSDQLKVHLMSVYKLIREGTLKATRVPGIGLRVTAKELEKLLDQGKGEQSETQEKPDGKTRK